MYDTNLKSQAGGHNLKPEAMPMILISASGTYSSDKNDWFSKTIGLVDIFKFQSEFGILS